MEMVDSRYDVIEAICVQLKQDNDRTRWSAVKSLSRIGACEAIPVLTARLHSDPDPDVRMEIARALGRLKAQQAVDALIATLHGDPDEDVRLQACQALGQLPSPQSLAALVGCLASDGLEDAVGWEIDDDIDFGATWEIQRAALEGLGTIGDEHAVEAIVQLMASDDLDDLEELGLRVLGEIGGKQAIDFVLGRLREGEPRTRRRAARALANVDDPAIRPRLIDALRDSEPDVRAAAGWALAAQHALCDPVAPHLTALLQDPDETVRLEAVNIVAAYRSEHVTEHLIRRLNDPHREVQLRVIQTLEDQLEPRAIAPMLALLAASRTEPALTAPLIKALGVLKAGEALAPICQLLEDEPTPANPAVRLQSALALGDIAAADWQRPDIGGEASQPERTAKAVERLKQLANDENLQVSRAALLSLAKLGEGMDVPDQPLQMDETWPETTAYPTSTLEAMEQASRVAASQATAERQEQIRQYAARLDEDSEETVTKPEAPPTTAEAIAKLHDDDRNEQRAALRALARLQDRSVIEALRAFLFAHGGELWPETLVALLELNDTELLTQLLTILEQSEQEEHHWIAIEALAEMLLHEAGMEG